MSQQRRTAADDDEGGWASVTDNREDTTESPHLHHHLTLLDGQRPPESASVPGAATGELAMMPSLPKQNGTRRASRPPGWLAALRADPRQAIQEDSIRCLICGRAFRQLTNTHLRGHHTTPAEYKRWFGYNRRRPLMCRALQQLYADRAVKAGLAAQIRSRPILVTPDLRRQGGSRAMALEESLTRRDVRRLRTQRSSHMTRASERAEPRDGP